MELVDDIEEIFVFVISFIGFVWYGKCILYGVMEVEEGSNGFWILLVDDEGEVFMSGRSDVVVNFFDEFCCFIFFDFM